MSQSAKEKVAELLAQIDDDCSLAEIQYRIYVRGLIDRRSALADTQPMLSHEQAGERLRRWLGPDWASKSP